MTREVTVTLDKNDMVQTIEATGSRWRFQRIRPIKLGPRRKLTEEQEQEICAMYVDRPNMSTRRIAEHFGINDGHISEIVHAYGIPGRAPRKSKNDKPKPDLGTRPSFPFDRPLFPPLPHTDDPNSTFVPLDPEKELPDPRPVWRVTMVRTVTEEIHADNLLDIAAYYDGQDVSITNVSRVTT